MIYFIRRGEFVKIGVTINVLNRVKTLQNASVEPVTLLGVMVGGKREERALHQRFHAKRIRGEWFKIDDEITDFVTANTGPFFKSLDGRERIGLDKLVQLNIKVTDEAKNRFEVAYEHARTVVSGLTKGDFYEVLLSAFERSRA